MYRFMYNERLKMMKNFYLNNYSVLVILREFVRELDSHCILTEQQFLLQVQAWLHSVGY